MAAWRGDDVAALGVHVVACDEASRRVLVATRLGLVAGALEVATLSHIPGESVRTPWRRRIRGERRSWEAEEIVSVACGGSVRFGEEQTGLWLGGVCHQLRSERPTLAGQRRFGHAQMPSLGGDILGVAPPVVRFHALLAHEAAVDRLVGRSDQLRARRVSFAEELVSLTRRDDAEAGRNLDERRARTSQAVLCAHLNLWRLADDELRARPEALALALELAASWEGTAEELHESVLAALAAGAAGGQERAGDDARDRGGSSG